MVAPLILEHVVDDVEALLGALAEVVHLEAAGGENPAAAGEAFLPAALVLVAREDVVAAGLDDGVHGPGEGFAEGPSPVLRYGQGDAASEVGVSARKANLISGI